MAKRVRIGINGLGRIGRCALRIALARNKEVEVVVVNDPAVHDDVPYLIQRDSIYGRFPEKISPAASGFTVAGSKVAVSTCSVPARAPWGRFDVDVVIDCSGRSQSRAEAAQHLEAGCGVVVVGRPLPDADRVIVVGLNEYAYRPGTDRVISAESCTTNCLVHVARVLYDRFGLLGGFTTTIHGSTPDQAIGDRLGPGGRRERDARVNIIPFETDSPGAVSSLLGRPASFLRGMAWRVPVTCGSVVTLQGRLSTLVTAEEVNDAIEDYAKTVPVIEVVDAPVVSTDVIGESASCIVDSRLTKTIEDDLVSVSAWYDNEWAYANRLIDLCLLVGAASPALPPLALAR